MNLHKNIGIDVVDLSLSRTLKNWMARKQPPINAKVTLLEAARQVSEPQRSKILVLFYTNSRIKIAMAEQYKNPILYSLQPGMNFKFQGVIL